MIRCKKGVNLNRSLRWEVSGDSLIPSEIFPGMNMSAPVVSVIRSINNLDQIVIKEKWLDLTQCELTFENLPMCLWGKDFAQLTVKNVNHNITNKSLILKDLDERKNVYCKLGFKDLPKIDYTIKPPIRGDIELFFNPEPKFKIDADKNCDYQIIDQNQKEIEFQKRLDGVPLILPRIHEYEKLEDTANWNLIISIDSKIIYSQTFEINPPPLSFYKLRLKKLDLTIQENSETGFLATFECEGFPPGKGDFTGIFVDENDAEHKAVVNDGKGRISFGVGDFDFSREESEKSFTGFTGSLIFEDFNKTFSEVNIRAQKYLRFWENDREIIDLSNQSIFACNTKNWPGSAIISIDYEKTFPEGTEGIGVKERTGYSLDLNKNEVFKYFVKDLKLHFPEINKLFLMGKRVFIKIELIAFSNREFGVKEYSIPISRARMEIESNYCYKDSCEEIWTFNLQSTYISNPSLLELIYSNQKFKPLAYAGSDTYGFKITHPTFDEIQKDNTWQLLFDGIELLEGEVEIPEIVFNRKYSNGEFLVIFNPEEEAISFSEFGELDILFAASTNNEKLEFDLELLIRLEGMDTPFTIPYCVSPGAEIVIDKGKFDNIEEFNLLEICKQSKDGEILGSISLNIPHRNNLNLIDSDSFIFAKTTGEKILSEYEKWLHEIWDGTSSGINNGEFSERGKELIWLILIQDLSTFFLRKSIDIPGIDHTFTNMDAVFQRRNDKKFEFVENSLKNDTTFGRKIVNSALSLTNYQQLNRWDRYKQWYTTLWGGKIKKYQAHELWSSVRSRNRKNVRKRDIVSRQPKSKPEISNKKPQSVSQPKVKSKNSNKTQNSREDRLADLRAKSAATAQFAKEAKNSSKNAKEIESIKEQISELEEKAKEVEKKINQYAKSKQPKKRKRMLEPLKNEIRKLKDKLRKLIEGDE